MVSISKGVRSLFTALSTATAPVTIAHEKEEPLKNLYVPFNPIVKISSPWALKSSRSLYEEKGEDKK